MVIEYLPGNLEAQEEFDWIINRLVENGVNSLPEDFFVHYQTALSPYREMFGPTMGTEEFSNCDACAKKVLS